MPSCRQRSPSPGRPADVSMTKWIAPIAGSARSNVARSNPSRSGMLASLMTSVYRDPAATARRASASASSAPAASSTTSPDEVRISRTMRRFVALSSTIRVRVPASCASRRVSAIPPLGSDASAMANANSLPRPGSLRTTISPPMSPTSRLVMARPSPVPP